MTPRIRTVTSGLNAIAGISRIVLVEVQEVEVPNFERTVVERSTACRRSGYTPCR